MQFVRGLFARNYRFTLCFFLTPSRVNNRTVRFEGREQKKIDEKEKWKWNSPWWKVERESRGSGSWRDELEPGDRCNRMLAKYHI